MGEGKHKVIDSSTVQVRTIVYSKNKTLLAFCFSFIVGASIFSWVEVSKMVFGALLVLACLMLFVVRRHHVHRTAVILVVLYFIGALRSSMFVPDCKYEKYICHYNGKIVELHGVILDEPSLQVGQTKYVVTVDTISDQPITGRVLLTTQNYPAFEYGDKLLVVCRLKVPENKRESVFRYDKYLAKEKVWSICEPIRIARELSSFENALGVHGECMRAVLRIKEWLDARVGELWSEPASSLMAGILYGSKSGLPDEVTNNFSNSGVTHIIAVSGFNITIIASVLMSMLIVLGLWRQQAFWVALVSIWLFTTLSGLSASAVRAAIMGSLTLFGVKIGRPNQIGTALVFTAALMVLVNPYVLMWDAGFQLSFLATIGLVYISPLIDTLISKTTQISFVKNLDTSRLSKHPIMGWLGEVVGEPLKTTVSAIIATTPLILYQFQRFSVVAPLVNVLVLWIIPWLMLGGLLAVVISIIYFPFAHFVAHVVSAGLNYVLIVTKFLGEQEWSSVDVAIPWWCLVLLYLIMVYSVLRQGNA